MSRICSSCKKRIGNQQCMVPIQLLDTFGCDYDQNSQLPWLYSWGLPHRLWRFRRKIKRNRKRKRHSEDNSPIGRFGHLKSSFIRHWFSRLYLHTADYQPDKSFRCRSFQLDMEHNNYISRQIVRHKCFRYTNPADTGNYCCSYRGSQAQKCSSHSDTASPLGNLQNLSKSVQQCSDRCHPMWNYNKHHMYNSSIDRFRLSSMLSNPSLQVQLRTHH